ncbi:hypothetical protein TSAR_000865 [Trichomalopsis sarcophagae]|uniref:Uncharacterized protein n=1 Tax=Trichomalopsis sarcophagae TaxID=543379 RepID=A0A232ESN0_9HYME|nr:hypothetical protein TSAR_000865 [Trichomalopsis sarcophagae]
MLSYFKTCKIVYCATSYITYVLSVIKISSFHLKHLKDSYQESRIKCFTLKAIIFLREEDIMFRSGSSLYTNRTVFRLLRMEFTRHPLVARYPQISYTSSKAFLTMAKRNGIQPVAEKV